MKHSHRFAYISAILLTMGLSAFARWADPPTEFDLSWNTIDSGGETFSTGGSFELVGGFWSGAGGPDIETCPPDIAPSGGNNVVDIDDLFAVIAAWGACPPPCPPCAEDIDGNCTVNIDDLFAVIAAWGPCP